MPLNPKVEFDFIEEIKGGIRQQFDQLRRWFENYEDNGNPTIQVFEGVMEPNTSEQLFVPGELCGVSGFTSVSGNFAVEGRLLWVPITTGLSSTTKIVFYSGTQVGLSASKNAVALRNTSDYALSYSVTAIYKG